MTAGQKQQLLPIRQNRKYSPGYISIEMDITEEEREERGLIGCNVVKPSLMPRGRWLSLRGVCYPILGLTV